VPKKDGELSDEELEQVVGGSKDMKDLFAIWRHHLNESVNLSVSSVEHPHQNLNESLWDDEDQLRSEVKEKLLEIAHQFIKKTKGAETEIKDITFTGSLANYNYSMLSDIDLHILIDFREVNDNVDLVKDYFNAVKALWNYLHDIRIKGYEVEVYVQDANEPHVSSGVYSIMNDEWIKKPESKEVDIDNELIAKKAESLMDQIDRALEVMEKGKHQEAHDRAIKIRKKIKKFRQAGLEREGEYSVENLAFKTLRNNGYLGKLSHLKRDAYDKMMSLKEGFLDTLGKIVKNIPAPIPSDPGGFGDFAAMAGVNPFQSPDEVEITMPTPSPAEPFGVGYGPEGISPSGHTSPLRDEPTIATTPTTTATVPTIPTTATAGMTSPTVPMSTTAPESPDLDTELTSEDSSSEETCERKPSRHRIKIIRNNK
jgi:hypothetical protein